MLTLSSAQRVYLACGSTDLRKSIDGLAALIQEGFGLDPFSPCLFVFCNRERNKPKILYWDHNGFWLFYRRLERGRFQWPTGNEGTVAEIQTITTEDHAAKVEKLEQQVAELCAKLKWYEEQFRLAQQKRFGASSEKTHPDQMELKLFNEAEVLATSERQEPTTEQITYERRKQTGKREADSF